MADELSFTTEQWNELLSKQMSKQAAKVPTRTSTPATKAYPEKSFVSFHFNALGRPDRETRYNERDPSVYVLLNFFMREGDTFGALCNDARNYQQTFQHAKIVVHSHTWAEPCSAAPKLQKCKEL